ncbi:MAG: pentapeptide repeat-containing protein, partial [Phenylobacterium sp.]
LTGALLADADLRAARLDVLVLSGDRFMATDMTSADLRRANLAGADLRGAILNDTDLRQANLTDANLKDAEVAFRETYGLKGGPTPG